MSTTPISHFTHRRHKLVMKTGGQSGCFTCRPTARPQDFTCRMCEAEGSGARYRCDACKFDLHEHCSLYPETLPSFFAHTPHQLKLVPSLAGSNRTTMCDLCYRPVHGYSYRCDACAFNLHPLCSLLPQTVRSNLHPQHPLTLHPTAPAACAACRENCVVWRYRCGLCKFELHTYCLDVAPAEGPENPHAKDKSNANIPSNTTAPTEPPPADDDDPVQKGSKLEPSLMILLGTILNVVGMIIGVAGNIIIDMINN